jgi:uncharacterized protein
MNANIQQLLALQAKDVELDRLHSELASIPAKIGAIKTKIQDSKTALENSKRDLIQLQLTKKQRDLDLETQESAIRKHSTELNAVKTNDAYRALMGEIEKAKREKSTLEDQILQVMEQIDAANKLWKEREAAAKGSEGDLLKQISNFESKQKVLQEQIAAKQAEREQAAAGISRPLFEPYERIRTQKKGHAVVPLRAEQCSGCHMQVSPNLINEVRRGQKLMYCEHCSRIVYLEEVMEKQAAG